MSLAKDDKNWIKDDLTQFGDELMVKIDNRFKELIIWMSQNFYTKDEAVSKDFLDEKLEPIKEQIREVQDSVASIDAKFTESIAMHVLRS